MDGQRIWIYATHTHTSRYVMLRTFANTKHPWHGKVSGSAFTADVQVAAVRGPREANPEHRASVDLSTLVRITCCSDELLKPSIDMT